MGMKEEKLLVITDVRTPAVQPVASRYPELRCPGSIDNRHGNAARKVLSK
jgi:hypothetical protein